ncbi:hypothetical protein INT45_008447 [Circinella minor]|uniref:Major facilitator superfamily (MFS) profile domain-containing protein n=1 Tax=Circinella minor TaxID=1195481 RepID=A0A8H7SFL9_9FUNG|nr:hypothetical protein INT45_008447 [Circinella minor]
MTIDDSLQKNGSTTKIQQEDVSKVAMTTIEEEKWNLEEKKMQYIDPVLEKRFLRKLDLRMVIWSFIASISNFLNRNNMQNAFTMGMDKDLNLDSSVYNWTVTMFFIGYLILQIPGNILITKVPPRWVLPTCAVLWGTIVSVMPAVKDYQTLWGLRFVLGLAQAPYYPGVVFLFGSWYKKNELAKRSMLVAAGVPLSGAVNGLISGAISKTMDGSAGLSSWRWLFIIEGVLGVLVGAFGYILLPNFPHNTPWLTPEERQIAIARVQNQDMHVVSNTYSWKTVSNVLLRPYPWLMIIQGIGIGLCLTMIDYFAIILRDLSYPVDMANYMLTPLYIFGTFASIAIGWSSDKLGDRACHIGVSQFAAAIWYMILGAVNKGDNSSVLVFIGVYVASLNMAMLTLCLTWLNEFYKVDHNTRAIAIAFINTMSVVIPNFINLKAWLVTDSPNFWAGKLTSMGCGFASVLATIAIWFLLRKNIMLPEATDKRDDESGVDLHA